MNKFSNWLNSEIEKRNWSLRELSRQADVSVSTISNVINQKTKPGWDLCFGIARAFSCPPEVVFRKAGLLPPKPEAALDEDRLLYIYRQLDQEGQRDLLAIARTLRETRITYKTEEE